tara:strand:- start:206 stop:589 length:384 start_codon:yes stop_codon:yes gene_type:complete
VLALSPKPHLFVSAFALNVLYVQEGEFYASHATFGITSLIPKRFQNQSFEAEEAAKELTIQAAKKSEAEKKAKQVATKLAASKQAKVTNTKQKTHQKPAKDKEQTASAPAKEDAPVTTPVTAGPQKL